jgi:hypothetical protein
MLTEDKKRATEQHFLTILATQISKYTYFWADHGHVYDMSSGKIVPQTWQGWFQLSKVVSKEFMNSFVENDCIDSLDALLFKSIVQAVKKAKEAEEVAKQEAKKADKKAKLLTANAAAMERDREAKEAIKKNSINHSNPVSTKITPEQIAAAELREKERLRQLELEEKAAKKALRELKIKTKGKKVKHC